MKIYPRFAALLALSALAAGAFAPSAADAGLKPGLWAIGGIQQICVMRSGFFYSTTFSGWNGNWENIPKVNEDRVIIYGNYDDGTGPGTGNDSLVVEKQNRADWIEWHDYQPKVFFIDDVPLSYVSKTCGPPATSKHRIGANPMD